MPASALLALLLVLIGRLPQGFSAGMELGGVSVYVSEIAPPGHKGFYVSWQSASQRVAVMFAALLGVVLSSVPPPQKMMLWGWRIPSLLGCLILPFLFRLRSSLGKTDLMLATAYPVMLWLVAAPSFSRLLTVELWLSLKSRRISLVAGRFKAQAFKKLRAVLAGLEP